MGKNKSNKIWKYCEKCLIYYVSNDGSLHNCDEFSLNKTSFSTKELLNAKLELRQKNDDNLYLSRLMYVNNATMDMMGMHFLQPVIFNQEHIFFAFPNQIVALDSVSICISDDMQLISGSMVEMRKLSQPFLAANNCIVKLSSDSKDLIRHDSLKDHFKQLLNNLIVKQNDLFKTEFLGVTCSLQFQHIYSQCKTQSIKNKTVISPTGEISPNLQDPTEKLGLELRKLSLFEPISDENNSLRFYQITSETVFLFEHETQNRDGFDIKDFGGYSKQLTLLNKMIDFIFLNDDKNLKQVIPTGILLHGPSGIGKSTLIRSLANLLNISIFEPPLQMFNQNKESNDMSELMEFCKKLKKFQPCIFFFENFERIFPLRKKYYYEINFYKRVIKMLMNLTSKASKVVIIASSSCPEKASNLFTSTDGLFTFKIEMLMPSFQERLDILQKIISKFVPEYDVDLANLNYIASSAHAYSSSDLHVLVINAMNNARLRSKECLHLTLEDLNFGLTTTTPSLMKEIAIENPMVSWEDVGGRNDLKEILKQSIQLPIEHPEVFERVGLKPPKGILMYGPPGCSKTMLAKAIATECKLNFISVQGTELSGKWVGETEMAISNLFGRARSVAPCVIFFDEIDAFALKRGKESSCSSGGAEDRAVQQLLIEMDGTKHLKDVAIIAATNRPNLIDEAFLRPGRFDRLVYVSLPDDETRLQIFDHRLRLVPCEGPLDLQPLVEASSGFSCAEVSQVVDEALEMALDENIDTTGVSQRHLIASALKRVPSTTRQQITFFEEYRTRHEH